MTAATIRTSVDLSTLITVPTKLHIDRHNLGRDERSKILASLQLAIERAQTYRDDLLQQEPALLSTITGHTTTTTATQFAYQQKQQGFQDYQNSYIDNDINQQQHQYQQEQQQQQTIEMLLRASAQSTEARAVEEQRNMVRTKWAAILYTAISTLGILFACA
ncbi:hypothetical protein BGZ97_008745, partial [Linnemannia gamsii]